MSKVTSKLQVTIPKAIARQYGIEPGDDVTFEPAGDAIRVHLSERDPESADVEWRLAQFDRATKRQAKRNRSGLAGQPRERGWSREDLYDRGLPR